MPELPEVETVRRSLLPLVGGRIVAVRVWERRLRRPLQNDFEAVLADRELLSLQRRGKYLLFELSGGTWMLAHLGMTGVLLLEGEASERGAHDHVQFRFSEERRLTFHDPRRFGVLRAGSIESFEELRNVGPDALDAAFTAAEFFARTRQRKKPIKNLLMDQPVLAGVGNIYANEALFRAGIRPGRRAASLTRAASESLFHALRACLEEAIELGGSSISDYRDGNGRSGYFQLTLAVYDRAGLPCPRCGTSIVRRVHAGRASFYCPRCQR